MDNNVNKQQQQYFSSEPNYTSDIFSNYYYNLSHSYFPAPVNSAYPMFNTIIPPQHNYSIEYNYKPVNQMTTPSMLPLTRSPTGPTMKLDISIATPPNTNTKLNTFYPTPPSENEISYTSSAADKAFDRSANNSPDLSNLKESHNTDDSDLSSTAKKEVSYVGTARTKRRTRTQYSKQQIDCLEAIFLKSHYPEVHVVDRLSDKLGLSIERISVWFQNRRAKFKKTKKPVPNNSADLKKDIDAILSSTSRSETTTETTENSSHSGYQSETINKLPHMPATTTAGNYYNAFQNYAFSQPIVQPSTSDMHSTNTYQSYSSNPWYYCQDTVNNL